jgi:hypothetical protein
MGRRTDLGAETIQEKTLLLPEAHHRMDLCTSWLRAGELLVDCLVSSRRVNFHGKNVLGEDRFVNEAYYAQSK